MGDAITNVCFIKAAGMNFNGGKCAIKILMVLSAYEYKFSALKLKGDEMDGALNTHQREREREEKCVKLLFRTSAG